MRATIGLFVLVLVWPAEAASQGRHAQRLVDRFVEDHPELVSLELALAGTAGCRIVAATAREEVGTMCDNGELMPMHTGKPHVLPPTKKEPVYGITQAFHDAKGGVVGAVGMTLKPDAGANRAAVMRRAAELLDELERRME